MSLQIRSKLYKYYKKLLKSADKQDDDFHDLFMKQDILGEGFQGKVYKYCKKNACHSKSSIKSLAVKKMYLEKKHSRYVDDIYNLKALKYEPYIELAANQMVNQLVLQGISPNFMLHYYHNIEERWGICSYDYPFKMYHYNELIDNAITYTDWVSEEHPNHVWYNAFFQITTALFALQKYFNMTHLDLHSDNILVKKIKKGGYWSYNINGNVYKVPNLGFQLFIVDFGHARIPNYFVSQHKKKKKTDKSFDIKELFKSTLSFSASPAKFKRDVNNVIRRLKNEDFDIIIEELWKDKYVFDTGSGKIKKHNGKNLDTFDLDKRIIIKNVHKDLKQFIIN